MTGDKNLRTAAQKEGIEVHGTVWIIEQLLNQKLLQLHKARASFDSMKAKGSRLPWAEVDRLLSAWKMS